MDSLPTTQITGVSAVPSKRDPRVDVLRGLALLMIFVDHIPGDTLNHFTIRNFGFFRCG
ncbi:MAG: OpgC domain-containing protein [Acetobacteraceae bacterium]